VSIVKAGFWGIRVKDKDSVLIQENAHKLFLTDLYGKCSFNSSCDKYSKGVGDKHVIEAILSTCGACNMRDGSAVLDIGSNVGQFSAMMRTMNCAVYAVDPQNEVSRFFHMMVLVNNWDVDGSIAHFPAFLGSSDGTVNITRTLWAPGDRRIKYNQTAQQMAVKQLVTRNFMFVKIDIDGPEGIVLRELALMIPQFTLGNIMVEVEISSRKHFSISDDEAVEIFHRFYDLNYHPYLTFLHSLTYVPEVEQLNVIPRLGYLENVAYIPRDSFRAVLFSKDKFTKNIFMGLGNEWSP
jgi:FkbM family methyltransferase